jgi:hypothetical protein
LQKGIVVWKPKQNVQKMRATWGYFLEAQLKHKSYYRGWSAAAGDLVEIWRVAKLHDQGVQGPTSAEITYMGYSDELA